MKTLFTFLMFLFVSLSYSQVGIGTDTPLVGTHLDVAGKVRIQEIPTVTSALYILTEDSQGIISKIALFDLELNKCPNLVQNSGYYIKFQSDSSIPFPNESLQIQGKNFVSAETTINNNIYTFAYSNTSGQPIGTSFTVNFSGLICQY